MRKAAMTELAHLVSQDPRVVFVGSDLGAGTMADVPSEFSDRVFMEGIAEQHLVGFGAGLALEGFVPYLHTIATFLTRRAVDQIVVDVALHDLPVRLIGGGGGMTYAPLGPTHQAIDDFALMRAIPGMQVYSPGDPVEVRECLRLLASSPGPAYVRVARGGEPDFTSDLEDFDLASARVTCEGEVLVFASTGSVSFECLEAARMLGGEGVKVGAVHFPRIQPLDEEALEQLSTKYEYVIVVEEHLPTGGLFTAVVEANARAGRSMRVFHASLPSAFAQRYGSQRDHWELHGLTRDGLASVAREIIKESQ
jgi:transketolase